MGKTRKLFFGAVFKLLIFYCTVCKNRNIQNNDCANHCGNKIVVIGDNAVTRIGDYAFYNCTGLTSINIPDSVTRIGDYAFYNCNSLDSIRFEGKSPVFSDLAFRGYNKDVLYPYGFSGWNSVIQSSYSGSKTLYFTILPGVTSKTATSTNSSAIKIAWKAVPGATGYRVYYYNPSTKKYTALKTTTGTSYTVTKLKSGTSYKFAVKAYTIVNGKVYWYSGYKTITATTNPGTPTLKVTAGTKKAALSWNKQTGATGYAVYMATSKNGKYTKIATLKGNTKVSFTKTGLTKGKTYYFKVAAYTVANGKTLYSSFSSVKAVKIK